MRDDFEASVGLADVLFDQSEPSLVGSQVISPAITATTGIQTEA